ncbi:hypothetical protein BU15DRAFT_70343 [Melanogaster broomeanus]|nr:hypothetical protein BU15DRAFT_70343 [Melanogaster broomeanus]
MTARLVRLTLFSSPHCSLCDVAKAELAKVKKLVCNILSLPCSKTSTLKDHQREFDLEVINIQDKGQERWKKKYVYWIPALHLDGKEVVKGRWDAAGVGTVNGVVDGSDTSPSATFVIDTSFSLNPLDVSLGHSCLYDKITGVVFGEAEDESAPHYEQDLRRCFNCGSPNHPVASCPEPVDRQLVALSRQLFNFLHPNLSGQEISRFYVAEGWKQQRLEWLESYEPGVIRGPLLRNALGLQTGDPGNAVEWLRNMTYWGYPPGWASHQDPRDLVRSRILADEEDEEGTGVEDNTFTLFGDPDNDEHLDLKSFNPRCSLVTELDLRSPADSSSASSSCASTERKRWASYPDTFFSSAALSLYSGTSLGRMDSPPARLSATFTADRRALWQRIISGDAGQQNNTSVLPWRLPGAFGSSRDFNGQTTSREFNPPPPSITPPPLPAASTPLHTSQNITLLVSKRMVPLDRVGSNSFSDAQAAEDDGVLEDMDVSDDSE